MTLIKEMIPSDNIYIQFWEDAGFGKEAQDDYVSNLTKVGDHQLRVTHNARNGNRFINFFVNTDVMQSSESVADILTYTSGTLAFRIICDELFNIFADNCKRTGNQKSTWVFINGNIKSKICEYLINSFEIAVTAADDIVKQADITSFICNKFFFDGKCNKCVRCTAHPFASYVSTLKLSYNDYNISNKPSVADSKVEVNKTDASDAKVEVNKTETSNTKDKFKRDNGEDDARYKRVYMQGYNEGYNEGLKDGLSKVNKDASDLSYDAIFQKGKDHMFNKIIRAYVDDQVAVREDED